MKLVLVSISQDDVWPLECMLRCGAAEFDIPIEIEYNTDLNGILKYKARSIPFLVFEEEIFFDNGLPTKSMVYNFFMSKREFA